MNEEERQAILHLRIYIEEDKTYLEYMETPLKELSDFDMFCINHCRDIATVLNLIDKQNKMIDKMADFISGSDGIFELPRDIATEKEARQYFEQQANHIPRID